MLINLIVYLFTGKYLNEYPESERAKTAEESRQKFVQWLVADMQENGSPDAKKMATRLKAAASYKDPSIFQKFPELETYLKQSYDHFVEMLRGKVKV